MPEIPRQYDLFTGELKDTRTRQQRQQDNLRNKPQQLSMFSQRDIAQFGVVAQPFLPLSPHMVLPMLVQDPRTEEEIEREQEQLAREQTKPLFEVVPQPKPKQEIRLSIIQQTPHAYLQQLQTTLQLPPPSITHYPHRYITHLQQVKQLPAELPKSYPVALVARQTFETLQAARDAFDMFLKTYKVYDRAQYQGWSRTTLLDTDDIAQMVVIQLWEQWVSTDKPLYVSDIWFAIREASNGNKWTARITKGKDSRSAAIESATPATALASDDGTTSGDEVLDVILGHSRGLNIRRMDAVDRRIDVEMAIETVTLYMMWLESLKPNPRHRTAPALVSERLDALFKGYMYYRNGGAIGHIGGRHNSYLQGYWKSRGLHKAMGHKWRDRVFPILAGLLAEYELPQS